MTRKELSIEDSIDDIERIMWYRHATIDYTTYMEKLDIYMAEIKDLLAESEDDLEKASLETLYKRAEACLEKAKQYTKIFQTSIEDQEEISK